MVDFFGFGKSDKSQKPAKQQDSTGLAGMGFNTVKLKRAYDEEALAKAVVGEPIEDFDKWVQKNYPDTKTVK